MSNIKHWEHHKITPFFDPLKHTFRWNLTIENYKCVFPTGLTTKVNRVLKHYFLRKSCLCNGEYNECHGVLTIDDVDATFFLSLLMFAKLLSYRCIH